MSTSHRRPLLAAASAVLLLALSACASGPSGSPAPTSTAFVAGDSLDTAQPALPTGRVIAVGTVIDHAGDVTFCGGAISESFPPQCHGIPIDGWSWEGLDGSETSGDATWGSYAVYATYDGARLTTTSDAPIMLALYDPIPAEDPTDGVDGSTPEAELTRIQDDLAARLGPAAFGLWSERGYVWLQVAWDDGTIQDAVDADYGPGKVIVTSTLREVD